MSQDFYKTFVTGESAQTTMGNLINKSVDALRTSFSGTSTPPSGETVQFQWWADTSAGILKLRNEADADWIDVYDFSNSAILINPSQITSGMIDDLARKPTLIEGEDIGPASCTIKTKSSSGALPMMSLDLFDEIPGLGTLVGAGWVSVLRYKIYVPVDVEMLYVLGLQKTCNLRFVLGALTSTEAGIVDPGPAWGSEAELDVSAISGWQDFDIQLESSTVGPVEWGGVEGLSSRWGD